MSEYLDRMGIIQWRLRDSEKNAYFKVTLSNPQEKMVGLILADVDPAADIAEQEGLLKKIAHALTPHFSVEIMSMIDADTIEKNNAMIILLGDQIQKIITQKISPTIINSFSLTHLLHHSNDKKKLWADIKPLRDAFL
jgi:DNA polymerase III psi subunit